jgi:hypothetical protein
MCMCMDVVYICVCVRAAGPHAQIACQEAGATMAARRARTERIGKVLGQLSSMPHHDSHSCMSRPAYARFCSLYAIIGTFGVPILRVRRTCYVSRLRISVCVCVCLCVYARGGGGDAPI